MHAESLQSSGSAAILSAATQQALWRVRTASAQRSFFRDKVPLISPSIFHCDSYTVGTLLHGAVRARRMKCRKEEGKRSTGGGGGGGVYVGGMSASHTSKKMGSSSVNGNSCQHARSAQVKRINLVSSLKNQLSGGCVFVYWWGA